MKICEKLQSIAVYFRVLLDNHVFLFHGHYSSKEGLINIYKISLNNDPIYQKFDFQTLPWLLEDFLGHDFTYFNK